jgi:hypothetical protein
MPAVLQDALAYITTLSQPPLPSQFSGAKKCPKEQPLFS